MASSVEPLGVGERLRNAREARGWSLADISELTRIRAAYLQALEEEQFDRLPGRVYLRGFLRTYATALGLNPDELFEAYHLELEAPAQPIMGTHSVAVPIRPAAPPSPLRGLLTYGAAAALVIVLVLGYVGYQQVRRFAAPVSPPQTPSQAAQPAPPLPAPAPRPTPSPPQPAPVQAPLPQPTASAPVTVQLAATEDSWIRIVADGERVFQGLLKAGDVRAWSAQSTLTVRIGNAPAVSVQVNGEPVQPPAGRRVWERTFTAP